MNLAIILALILLIVALFCLVGAIIAALLFRPILAVFFLCGFAVFCFLAIFFGFIILLCERIAFYGPISMKDLYTANILRITERIQEGYL